jgi:hypothetical protein
MVGRIKDASNRPDSRPRNPLTKFIDWLFPEFSPSLILRMSGVGVDSPRCQASLRLIGPCSLALPVQSINLQDAALSRDLGWKIADFRTSHAVKVHSLALMPYCRGSDSVATRSVGTLKLIASGCQK